MNSSSEGGAVVSTTRNSAAAARDVESSGPDVPPHPIRPGVVDMLPPDDAPPIPPAQLDANMHIQEKIRSIMLPVYPSSNNAPTPTFDDEGDADDGETAAFTDDGSIRVVRHGNAVIRPPLNNTPYPHILIHSSSPSADGQGSVRRGSGDGEVLDAMVEDGSEMVVAQPVGFFERKSKPFALCLCFLTSLLVVWLVLTLTGVINIRREEVTEEEVVLENTSEPSLSPSFDPRSTLEIVQERGHVRCGLRNETIKSGEGFHLDLCRSVAAVLVGNPDSFEGVPVTFASRWQHLLDRTVDVVILGDTYTIEREVKESSTGAGFSFSTVFNYDGMVYLGTQTFVQCAEEQKRYDECVSIMICVESSSTHYDFLRTAFPSRFIKVGSSLEEIMEMLFNGTCNVLAHEKSFMQNVALLNDGIRDGTLTLGNQMKTKEPHAMITRNNDREFSDIINWVVQALFFGEEQGLTKDTKFCKNYTDYFLYDVSDLNFMNAVYCVGSYGDIVDNNWDMNRINDGTGMLYAIPFGNLDKDTIDGPASGSTLAKIRNEGSFNCGVVVPDGFEGNVTESDNIVGMGVEYCRVLAAALLDGDPNDVTFPTFGSKLSSYIALANGEIDVLVGDRVLRKFDFERSPSLAGFHFSTPYYYGDESASNDVSLYSMATREDDVLFASFVNCIVLATIYAQDNRIHRDESSQLPLVSVFGRELDWALRDAIVYSGSYDEIYSRNFGTNVSETFRGRNTLNEGGPMMHSLPHLP